MILVAIAIAAGISAALWMVAARYRSRFMGRRRVVMQWSLTGKPTWSAAPRIALAFIPVLGTAVMAFILGLIVFATPPAQRGEALPGMAFTGLLLLAVQVAHLHFAARSRYR